MLIRRHKENKNVHVIAEYSYLVLFYFEISQKHSFKWEENYFAII